MAFGHSLRSFFPALFERRHAGRVAGFGQLAG